MSQQNDLERVTGIAEEARWTIDRIIEKLDTLDSWEIDTLFQNLGTEPNVIAEALETAMPILSRVGTVRAVVRLLKMGYSKHVDTFFKAFSDEDRAVRNVAFDGGLNTVDRAVPDDRPGSALPVASYSRDDLFAALRPLLDDTEHEDHQRAVYAFANQDFARGSAYILPLLASSNVMEQLKAAKTLVSNGRDDGALAVLESLLERAPELDPNGVPRWYDIQTICWSFRDCCRHGESGIVARVGEITAKAIRKALSSPDWTAHTHNGFLDVYGLCEVLEKARPLGGETILVDIVHSDSGAETRGKALGHLAALETPELRYEALFLDGLKDEKLREYAAGGLLKLPETARSAKIVDLVATLTEAETDGKCLGALARLLMAFAPDRKDILSRKLEAMPPLEAMYIHWQIEAYTPTDLYRKLLGTDAIDPIPDDQIQTTMLEGADKLDLLSIIHTAGARLCFIQIKQSSDPDHSSAFAELVRILRPTPPVESIVQTIDDKALYEPLAENPDIIQRTELGTVSTVEYVYSGKVLSFETRPLGRWLDIAAVYNQLNDFLIAIEHPQRIYPIGGDWGEFSMFLSANAERFPEIARELKIPINHDLEQQRRDGMDMVARMLGRDN